MSIELSDDDRKQLIDSIQRYSDEFFDEPIGNLGASSLLNFCLAEIGPVVYNRAVRDVQDRLTERIAELDIDVYEEPFQYWSQFQKSGKKIGKKK